MEAHMTCEPEEIEKVAKLFRYPFEDIRGIRESEWTATSESERILYCSAAKYHLEQTASLRQEIEGLRKDKERLDTQEWHKLSVGYNSRGQKWTVQNQNQVVGHIGSGRTLRDALDAAMQPAKEAK